MTDLVFALPAPSLAVAGSAARFAVRRIWCVGRNYPTDGQPGRGEREPPYFFSKQPDMAVDIGGGGAIRYPGLTRNLQYEVELVVALKAGGENIDEAGAASLIFGHAVGLDMTRRDLQLLAQEKGKSWEMAKSFEQSAPVGAITPASAAMTRAAIRLSLNGDSRQESDIDRMIWNIPEILARLSRQVALGAGDLIFTGTPPGVGPCVPGDRIAAAIEGLEPIAVTIA